jgi:hypothetical protein
MSFNDCTCCIGEESETHDWNKSFCNDCGHHFGAHRSSRDTEISVNSPEYIDFMGYSTSFITTTGTFGPGTVVSSTLS